MIGRQTKIHGPANKSAASLSSVSPDKGPGGADGLAVVSLVSVILPIRNQADHIEAVVRAYWHELNNLKIPFEMLLVSNACEDATPSICDQLGAELTGVYSLVSDKAGWGAAIKLGLQHARGEMICYTSASRTCAETLSYIITVSMLSPNCVTTAVRQMRDNWYRHLGSSLYNSLCRTLFGIQTEDVNGFPRVFPSKFDRLLELREDGNLIDLEFNTVCKLNDYPIKEIPVLHTARHGGRSTTTFITALSLFSSMVAFWLCRKHKG